MMWDGGGWWVQPENSACLLENRGRREILLLIQIRAKRIEPDDNKIQPFPPPPNLKVTVTRTGLSTHNTILINK